MGHGHDRRAMSMLRAGSQGSFRGAGFSRSEADFNRAVFSGGAVTFKEAEFSGGTVDFSSVRRDHGLRASTSTRRLHHGESHCRRRAEPFLPSELRCLPPRSIDRSLASVPAGSVARARKATSGRTRQSTPSGTRPTSSARCAKPASRPQSPPAR
jgi:hypothetical protein